MLVFPAYLQHSVDASASDKERISISFNIMFSSFTENLSKPLWQPAAAPTRTIAKTKQNSPVLPREAAERQSSAAVTAANVADHQSRDPFGCMHLTPDKLQNSQV